MNLTKMFHAAKSAGVATESKMWKSVDAMANVMQILESEHPAEYWCMMREQHEILWGPHYDEEFANHDVSMMRWTGRDNQTHHGGHWSREQVAEITKEKTFPAGVTECDKYVAFNSFYADMCRVINEQSIIEEAFMFYFHDEDAPEGKIWRYMRAMNK